MEGKAGEGPMKLAAVPDDRGFCLTGSPKISTSLTNTRNNEEISKQPGYDGPDTRILSAFLSAARFTWS